MTALLPAGQIVITLAVIAALIVILWVGLRRVFRLSSDSPPAQSVAMGKCVPPILSRTGLEIPADLSLPRLIAALLCLMSLVLLIGLLLAGLTAQSDAAVNAFFAPYRTPWMLAAFLWITSLGTGATLSAMAVIATGFVWANGRRWLLFPFWTTFLGAEATTWLVKFIINRPRPAFLPNVASASSPSFPSAHATATMAVVGFLAYAIACDLPGRQTRFDVGYWAAVAVGIIGLSRLFLNLHYISDVAGGFLVGAIWLVVGFQLSSSGRARG